MKTMVLMSGGAAAMVAAAFALPAQAQTTCPAKAAWNAATIYPIAGCQATEGSNVYQSNWWTQGNDPATNNGGSGSGQPWTLVSGSGGGGTGGGGTGGGGTGGGGTGSGGTGTGGGTGGGASADTGAINFHLLLGAGSAQDTLTLNGGAYDDLIMSNMIAGVMLGHLVKEGIPAAPGVPGVAGPLFNADYLQGTVFGQLLQENIATEYYTPNDTQNRIDSSPSQQAVMGVGQGGPYQINSYAEDLVGGGYAPVGHSLVNYVAIQKNIGYTMATAATQYTKATPPSFNNKYYGPILCAFFHYNDMAALYLIGKGTGGWTTPWEPNYDKALKNFQNLPHNFLDILLNVAYNQGYYGLLMPTYGSLGATATAATVASVNNYASVWGNQDTYAQYPYQVRYYLDQLYDNPIPAGSLTTLTTPKNAVYFPMEMLGTVFANVAHTLSYSNGTAPAQFFTIAQANTAFAAALTQNNVAATATLNLSLASDRTRIFAVIDGALTNLEIATGFKFIATTLNQL